ncbi:methyltransferase-like protein 13 isoform X2 [Ananas comosus]|uniref:Methyltransferase-like protein 13 isoform X2 n=1 Tax=Ananas comosus TaxID=4615 RepID=A0A6P5GJH7_ANACO|nr:methyltransferase-like protein 13 isoform X2 [Ananas comosus]
MYGTGGGGGGGGEVSGRSREKQSLNYGDPLYWDLRYMEEGGAAFDWYQRYSALRPFVRKFVPTPARVLMVGCGSALMSEDMVKDGYVDIMNIDISSIVIEMMRTKYAHVPQLKYMQMDVRDMSFFRDESFDCVIDKDAPVCASQMVEEVSRLLRPGGIFMLITYGDPSVRIPHLNQARYGWKIVLFVIPRPGFQSTEVSCPKKSILEPVPLTEKGQLPAGYVLEDPDSHYIYVCKKMHEFMGTNPVYRNQLEADGEQ